MSKVSLEVSPVWCNNKIITYDFCLTPYACLSGTTSPMPTLYNGKVYYTIPTSPQTFLWWSINVNKWIFSEVLGTVGSITLDYQGDYPYDRGTKWDGNFGTGYFRTCDCTCFTKPNYTGNQFLPINECGIITIHPMVVNCISSSPIKVGGNGSISVQIAGGTPPYSIRLLNTTGNVIISNSNLILIPNLQPGTYFIEITDNFGDFQQVINCTIIAPPPPPTPTPTPLPIPSYQEFTFCLSIRVSSAERVTIGYNLTFSLYSFNYINNIVTPIYISITGEEFVSWDYTNNLWSLSATSLSQLTTQLGPQTPSTWKMTNLTPLLPFPTITVPTGVWSLFNTVPTYTGPIGATRGICVKQLVLLFWIEEGWWQYYGSNIPNQYRGSSCGGNNKTPHFRWSIQNLGNYIVTDYEMLCTHDGTGDVYWDITNINPTQYQVSDTIPWQSPAVTGSTVNNSLRNNRGWQGPCLPSLSNPNFTVTLTANISGGIQLIAKINFTYCQTIPTGLCII